MREDIRYLSSHIFAKIMLFSVTFVTASLIVVFISMPDIPGIMLSGIGLHGPFSGNVVKLKPEKIATKKNTIESKSIVKSRIKDRPKGTLHKVQGKLKELGKRISMNFKSLTGIISEKIAAIVQKVTGKDKKVLGKQ